jgi:A/G-specific adenine glycosylase
MPETDAMQDNAAYCTQRFGASAGPVLALPTFTHTFTHFRLHITPLLAQLPRKSLQIQEPGSVWLDVEDALQAAIPAPVRKLLQQVQARRILMQT